MDRVILNAQGFPEGQGSVASRLLAANMDPLALRPWYDEHGIPRMTVNTGRRDAQGMPIYEARVTNAPTTLLRDQWVFIDDEVKKIIPSRMRIVGDIQGAGLGKSIPNGLGKTIALYQRMSDVTPATISMDPVREGDRDAPLFDLAGTPLPVIHKDFSFTLREIKAHADSGEPLDTGGIESATRKVIEEVEKICLGVSSVYSYGGYSIYGFTNFPQRLTQTLTSPTSSNHGTTLAEIISMRQKAITAGYFGPYRLYVSPAWDAFMDEDYSTTKGENTLRQRILALPQISSVETAYFLTGTQMLLVQMTGDVLRLLTALPITVVQWEEKGGMSQHFKVMCSIIPQLKSDYNGKAGIVHGS